MHAWICMLRAGVLASLIAGIPAFGPSTTGTSLSTGDAPENVSSPPAIPRSAAMPRSAWNGFVENRGQWPTEARFVARFPGMVVRVEPTALVIDLSAGAEAAGGVLVRQVFEGACAEAVIEGETEQAPTWSWFLGNDPARWQNGVCSYAQVRVRDMYPGIDLVLREEEGRLKYDVLVAPGADLERFVARFEGVEGLRLSENGALVAETARGPLVQERARSWQSLGSGSECDLESSFRLMEGNRVAFDVPERDPGLPLVIDPAFYWGTYLGTSLPLGGVAEAVWALTPSPDGEILAAGSAGSWGFPFTPGAYDDYYAGVPGAGALNIFIAKFRALDGTLLWAALVGGGHQQQQPSGIGVDALGNVFVAGWTFAADFPTTPGAFDTVKNAAGGAGFVIKLDPSGSNLLYSTFLEGQFAQIEDLAVTPSGSAIVGGYTGCGYPTTPGAMATTCPNDFGRAGFITRLHPTGSTLDWSTYVPGALSAEIRAVAIDRDEHVTITGRTQGFPVTPGAYKTTCNCSSYPEGFVARVRADGAALLWGTYLGGSRDEQPTALAIDRDGGVIVGGWTYSHDFPTTSNAFQPQGVFDLDLPEGFVSRLASTGSTLLASTYFGGFTYEEIYAVAVDASGLVTVAGQGGVLPVTAGAHSTIHGGGTYDGFVTRFDRDLTRIFYSSYLGGPGGLDGMAAVALSPTGRAFVGGFNNGGGFPTTPGTHQPTYGGGQTDAVLVAMDLLPRGIESYGRSTPGCLGPLNMLTSAMPAAGAQRFAFLCSGAPPGAFGWLIVGRAASATGFDVGGARLWIERALAVQRFPVQSDAHGYVERLSHALLGNPGDCFVAQYLFQNPQACPGSSAFSASNALLVTVQ